MGAVGLARRGFGNNKPPIIYARLQQLYGKHTIQDLDQAPLRLNKPMYRNQPAEVMLKGMEEIQMFLMVHPDYDANSEPEFRFWPEFLLRRTFSRRIVTISQSESAPERPYIPRTMYNQRRNSQHGRGGRSESYSIAVPMYKLLPLTFSRECKQFTKKQGTNK